jgi:hypothetical protein
VKVIDLSPVPISRPPSSKDCHCPIRFEATVACEGAGATGRSVVRELQAIAAAMVN